MSPASIKAVGRDRGYGECPFGSTTTAVTWFLEKQRQDTIVNTITDDPGKDFQNDVGRPSIMIDESGKPSVPAPTVSEEDDLLEKSS